MNWGVFIEVVVMVVIILVSAAQCVLRRAASGNGTKVPGNNGRESESMQSQPRRLTRRSPRAQRSGANGYPECLIKVH
jgi:hypothetical protein